MMMSSSSVVKPDHRINQARKKNFIRICMSQLFLVFCFLLSWCSGLRGNKEMKHITTDEEDQGSRMFAKKTAFGHVFHRDRDEEEKEIIYSDVP